MNDQSIKNHSESVRRSYRPEARQTSRINKQEDSYLENCKKERNKIFKYKSKAWESSPPNTTVSSSYDETSLNSVRKKSAKKSGKKRKHSDSSEYERENKVPKRKKSKKQHKTKHKKSKKKIFIRILCQ